MADEMRPNVTVTAAAEKFMRRIVRFSGRPTGGFRLLVRPGGCSGLSSTFSVDAAPSAGDAELVVDGLRIFLPAESRVLLEGATVDFADSPTQSGLVIRHSGAAACGCSGAGAIAPPAVATVALASLKRR